MVKKQDNSKHITRKERRLKERTDEGQEQLVHEHDEMKEVDNDFFMEDADEADYRKLDDDADDGSNLDFDDELDYDSSEREADKVEDEDEEKKEFKLTSQKFKSIKKKALTGSAFHISQAVVIFSKAVSMNDNTVNDDDSEDKEEGAENILHKKSACLKIIKFCLKEVPELLQMKSSKSITKRFLGAVTKFLKNGEMWDPSIILLAFKQLINHVNLIKNFKTYTEIFIKLGVKYWLELDFEGSAFCLGFLKEIAVSGEFDFVLKSCYLGYLTVAKAMNRGTYDKIMLLTENILYLIKSADSDVGYKNVFLFLRKICLELNRTINDKKWNSIKSIYNWQVINSLNLWTKVLCASYTNEIAKVYQLLAYPLIQIIVGIIRLHSVNHFFPLRLNLVTLLNKISDASGIFIPVSNYLIEILESTIFSKYYRKPKEPEAEINNVRNKKKMKLKQKKEEIAKSKHFMAKEENANFKQDQLATTLKIKEFLAFETVDELLSATLHVLIEHLSVHCYKINYPEISFPVVFFLKKLNKSITQNEFKEKIKVAINLASSNTDAILNARNKIKQIEMKNSSLISQINQKFKSDVTLPILEKIAKEDELEAKRKEIEEIRNKGEYIVI